MNSAKKKEGKQSPFKKAGDYFIRRMRNMSGSGDVEDEDSGQIFNEVDCVDAVGLSQDRFYA